jgi:hypothetical protein
MGQAYLGAASCDFGEQTQSWGINVEVSLRVHFLVMKIYHLTI